MSADLPTCIAAQQLADAIYARPGGGAGCCWHVVLDDGNVGDGSIEYCIEYAQASAHPDCVAIGPKLLAMSPTQRRKLRTGGYRMHVPIGVAAK